MSDSSKTASETAFNRGFMKSGPSLAASRVAPALVIIGVIAAVAAARLPPARLAVRPMPPVAAAPLLGPASTLERLGLR